MKFSSDWVTKHSDVWLTFLSHFKGVPTRALEIGSFEGRSAIWFLQNVLTHPASSIYCVDPMILSKDSLKTFHANIRESGFASKVSLKKKKSEDVRLPRKYYDFAYVDGQHRPFDVMHDMMKAWDALKPGGILIVDDRLLEENGGFPIKEAVDYFEKLANGRGGVLHRAYQLIMRKR